MDAIIIDIVSSDKSAVLNRILGGRKSGVTGSKKRKGKGKESDEDEASSAKPLFNLRATSINSPHSELAENVMIIENILNPYAPILLSGHVRVFYYIL